MEKKAFIQGVKSIVQSGQEKKALEKSNEALQSVLRTESNAKSRSKTLLWQTLELLATLVQSADQQRIGYNKLNAELYLNLQLLLGNQRLGLDWSQQRNDLLRTLEAAISSHGRQTFRLPAVTPPPALWKISDAEEQLGKLALEIPSACSVSSRHLTEELLLALAKGSAADVETALVRCGIQPVFYGDAPEEHKESFLLFDHGGDYPGLFIQGPDGALQLLCQGGHVPGRDGTESLAPQEEITHGS